MAGNSLGNIFRISTFGESHGKGIGVVIDGCPAGVPLSVEDIQQELNRRKPGQSKITTPRKETDEVSILSGVFEDKTLGTPIALFIANQDQRSKDYSHIKETYRPSHADFTYQNKYKHRDYRGGGRASARETAARVAAGAVAKKFLAHYKINITAFVAAVGKIKIEKHYSTLDFNAIESNIVRCPEPAVAQQMINAIENVKKQGDSLGGIITCVIQNTPAGLGEPVFDKLHAELGKAMLSINAVKGFEYGSGFKGTEYKGSEHNDIFEIKDNSIQTKTNYSGGIQGGISNGMDIYCNIAFKPVATILQKQKSINQAKEKITLDGKGRHDPCVVPRAVPIVEAMAALVIADYLLLNRVARV